ncbi:hypothetical protein HPB49_024415 [Dermacentor silvarum]|uniref:Uncharacterized protein n=1 Tax=Dermacentor silvarum TaxID=543639 RepID=A0ACB8DRD8_DERSI|nr:hypothetical protein HPB49_024415 [Dermacentor silvarum]
MSSLFGQFLEFGPLGLDADGKLYKRLHTMQSDVSVIYLDVPVGSGYSFTKDTSGYPDNLEGIAAEAIEFLAQFLVLFPEYKERDFYAAGESYGARYAIAIAYQLRTEQVERVPLKLQGAIAGDGFMGSIFDVADSGEFLYQASMVTPKGRDALAKQFSTMRSLVAEGKETEALQILLQTIFANPTSPTLFQNLTLYNQQASALYSEAPASMFKLYEYVDTKEFREAIHVGLDVEFQKINQDLLTSIELDYLRDISAEVELLLNTKGFLVLTSHLSSLEKVPTAIQESRRPLARSRPLPVNQEYLQLRCYYVRERKRPRRPVFLGELEKQVWLSLCLIRPAPLLGEHMTPACSGATEACSGGAVVGRRPDPAATRVARRVRVPGLRPGLLSLHDPLPDSSLRLLVP